jgi:hypothetical protein
MQGKREREREREREKQQYGVTINLKHASERATECLKITKDQAKKTVMQLLVATKTIAAPDSATQQETSSVEGKR